MSVKDFLAEIPPENFPNEVGPWMAYDMFDPPFLVGQLRDMRKQGMIELDQKNRRFRLTMKATCELRASS